MKMVIAYIRVSSREQGRSGFGFKSQEAEISAFAEVAGYRVARFYEEVASAIGNDSVKGRSRLQAAIRQARKLKCPILVVRLDRLSRSATEIEELALNSGVEVIVTRQNAHEGILKIRVEAARVQKETEMLKERTKAGLEAAKRQGKVFGNRTNLAEAQKKGAQSNQAKAKAYLEKLAPEIARIRASGAATASTIAEGLNKRGLQTARKQKWTEANLRRLLRQIDDEAKEHASLAERIKENPMWGTWG